MRQEPSVNEVVKVKGCYGNLIKLSVVTIYKLRLAEV